MSRGGLRLSIQHQGWLYGTFGMLFISGVVWVILHYFFFVEDTFGSHPSPFESWSLAIHGGAAMVFMLVLGSLIPGHMKFGWKARRNHRSGLTIVGANLLLILTGYLLYYSGGELLRKFASTFHTVIGVIVLPLLIVHVYGVNER